MVEEQKRRLENEFHRLLDDLDKSHLRKLQYDMHMCAAQCCQTKDGTMEQVHQCMKNCNIPVDNAQTVVQNEVSSIQTRLERCIMQCNDDVRDDMSPNPTSAEMTKYNQKFESCASKCFDNVLLNIPKLANKITQKLKDAY
ncbi:hypothetical protein LSTR_LSTR013119 [Laodelphax striatellus]|uniref:Protein FAM136A n=1 Tax=Laodelphax striatellus TaxID=195883 RepID=A0A482XHE0_LAOST|nr:hypothetical protein LSTR_LSTR013119 [Laodelphax striatellus]